MAHTITQLYICIYTFKKITAVKILFRRWHTVAVSVKGKYATLFFDGKEMERVALNRDVQLPASTMIDTSGQLAISHVKSSKSTDEPFEVLSNYLIMRGGGGRLYVCLFYWCTVCKRKLYYCEIFALIYAGSVNVLKSVDIENKEDLAPRCPGFCNKGQGPPVPMYGMEAFTLSANSALSCSTNEAFPGMAFIFFSARWVFFRSIKTVGENSPGLILLYIKSSSTRVDWISRHYNVMLTKN